MGLAILFAQTLLDLVTVHLYFSADGATHAAVAACRDALADFGLGDAGFTARRGRRCRAPSHASLRSVTGRRAADRAPRSRRCC